MHQLEPSPLSSSQGSLGSARSFRMVQGLLQTPRTEPEMVLSLRDLKLDIKTIHMPYRHVEFELEVRRISSTPSAETAVVLRTLSRPISDYSALRKRLLRELHPGHNCAAECKWLHTVVKQHFPKTQLTFVPYPFKTERRRVALLRALTTIQSALVNRSNQGCQVLMGGVLEAFAVFILEDRTSFSHTSLPLAAPGFSAGRSSGLRRLWRS